MMKSKLIFIFTIIFISGCTQSKEYSIYSPENFYVVGHKDPIQFPSDIKLRKAQSAEFYLPKSQGLPKPIPSILPPNSEALRVYLADEDRLDMPYYERFPVYSMPVDPTSINEELKLNHYDRQPIYPLSK